MLDEAQPPDDAEDRTARHLRLLRELADLGMQIARGLAAQAAEPMAEPGAEPRRVADPGLAFSRIAKAVRQTLALETRLAEGLGLSRGQQARRKVDAQQLILESRQEDMRDFVARAIEADVERRDAPRSEAERVLEDLDERLEDGDYDDALGDPQASTAELVRRICEDLGVTIDWRIWPDQDWAVQHLLDNTPTDIGADRWDGLDLSDPNVRPHPRYRTVLDTG